MKLISEALYGSYSSLPFLSIAQIAKGAPPFSLLNYPINNIHSTNNRGASLEVGPLSATNIHLHYGCTANRICYLLIVPADKLIALPQCVSVAQFVCSLLQQFQMATNWNHLITTRLLKLIGRPLDEGVAM